MENQTELSNIESNQEPDVNTLPDEETLNNEPEYIPEPNPWDDAPTGVWFYDIQYEDGHLGNMTQSAERAYKRGWNMSNNLPVNDVQQSDINGYYYPKELCPMKTEEDKFNEAKQNKLSELKKTADSALNGAYVVSSLGFKADANTTAVRDLEGLAIIGADTVMFCDFYNEYHALTKEQVLTLQREVLLNGQNLYAQKWGFRQQINEAETIEAINAVEIHFDMLSFQE